MQWVKNCFLTNSTTVLLAFWKVCEAFLCILYSAQLYYKNWIPCHCVIIIYHANRIAESVIRNVSPRSLPASSLCPYADTLLSKTNFTIKLKITLTAIDNKDYCICAWSFASAFLEIAVSARILRVQSETWASSIQQYRRTLVPNLFSLRSMHNMPPNTDHAHNKHMNHYMQFQSSTGYHSLMMDPMWSETCWSNF